MDNVEIITTYKFTKPNGERVDTTVKYNADTQRVISEYASDDLESADMPASWWLDALEQKAYNKLNKQQLAIYNFLQERL